MARRTSGSLYWSKGFWFLAVSLGSVGRKHLKLDVPSEQAAKLRQQVIADVVERLMRANRTEVLEAICRQLGAATDAEVPSLVQLADGLVRGTERVAPPTPTAVLPLEPGVTFEQFADLWTSNELARRYPGRVDEVEQDENKRRLKNHILSVVFRGRRVGDIPLAEFDLDCADFVLAQPSIPRGSLRHVAQVMHRVLRLSVYPARSLRANVL